MATAVPPSFLSNPNAKYNYDFVVATTQASINATMKSYFSQTPQPVTNACFVADASGNTQLIDYATLVKNAKGSDPFSVPSRTHPATNQDLKNLTAARFMFGFRIKLGIPSVSASGVSLLPDFVTFKGDASSLTFQMMCSTFQIVYLQPAGGYSSGTWTNQSQPEIRTANDLWIFSTNVDLRLDVLDKGSYSKLPSTVQAQIKNLGSGAFSVQQLAFDLTNGGLETLPVLPPAVVRATPILDVLKTQFVGIYFNALQATGQPFVGCAIVQNSANTSTLPLTNMNFEVDPLLAANGAPYPSPTKAQQDLTTLNYLCAVNGKPLPAAAHFPWNWASSTAHDGVVAINRNTLANYFLAQLEPYVRNNCLSPYVRTTMDGLSVDYSWSLTRGQTPTVSSPATGATVLSFAYSASSTDVAGLDADMGKLVMSDTYSMTVQFVQTPTGEATIVITQHQVIYSYVRLELTSGDGNIVDVTIVDTYTLSVDPATGRLVANLSSTRTDSSYSPQVNKALNFFTNMNSLLNTASGFAQSVVGTGLADMPISIVQDFVFPGGKAFVFKSVGFSQNQDLVSYISYAA